MIRDLRMNKIVVFFFAILLFLGTNCYFVWRSSLLHNIQILWIILSLYFLFYNPKFIDRKNILLSFFFCIAFFVYSLKISENFIAVIYYLFFPLTLLIPLSCRKDIMCFFLNSLFPILLLVSIIPYILVGLNLIHLPSFWIPPINSIKDYGYMNYLFFLSPDNTDVLSRFHSFYDEPGVIGSLSALILFLFFDILNKKSKIVYLLAGVLSFSFFFYVILLYLLIAKRILSLKNIFVILLGVGMVIYIFSFFDSDFLQLNLFGRFAIEDGRLAGDNRMSDDFSNFFWRDFVFRTDEFLFGTNDSIDKSLGGASIFISVYKYGVLWVCFTVLLYVYTFYKYKRNFEDFILTSLLFFGMMYQRPYLTTPLYFLLFTTAVEMSKFNINHKFSI